MIAVCGIVIHIRKVRAKRNQKIIAEEEIIFEILQLHSSTFVLKMNKIFMR